MTHRSSLITHDSSLLPPLYLLAGGKSSRFGSDKARAVIEGQPLLLKIAETLAPAVNAVSVVADRAGKYADLGLRTIVDVHPGQGPLSGLEAALRDLSPGCDWLLLCACDLLGVDARWVDYLLERRTPGATAVAVKEERWQPLFALYHRNALGAVEKQLAGPNHAMQPLLDAIAISVPAPPGWHKLHNINTPLA